MSVLNSDEKNGLKTCSKAVELFREIRHDMPMHCVASFLLVAQEEGLDVIEYAKLAKVSPSVMSRYLLDIGEREGFGLVHQQADPPQRVFLTDNGRVLADRIIQALEPA